MLNSYIEELLDSSGFPRNANGSACVFQELRGPTGKKKTILKVHDDK